jgi:hypothetical protein
VVMVAVVVVIVGVGVVVVVVVVVVIVVTAVTATMSTLDGDRSQDGILRELFENTDFLFFHTFLSVDRNFRLSRQPPVRPLDTRAVHGRLATLLLLLFIH